MKTADSFIIHTGNLNQMQDMVVRRYKNSSEEIFASFKIVANSTTTIYNRVISPNSIFSNDFPKEDTKTTLKVSLSYYSVESIISSVRTCLKSLSLDALSQLIVAFPYNEFETLTDSEWLDKVCPIWTAMEELVSSGSVHTIGVSDLDVDRLRLLCNSAISHPPTINHYSIDGCCTVPPELVEFAKERDIQLLTHNDTRNLVIKDEVRGLVENISGRDMVGYENGWTARYTIWIRSRSVVAAKGYFLQFEKSK